MKTTSIAFKSGFEMEMKTEVAHDSTEGWVFFADYNNNCLSTKGL